MIKSIKFLFPTEIGTYTMYCRIKLTYKKPEYVVWAT